VAFLAPKRRWATRRMEGDASGNGSRGLQSQPPLEGGQCPLGPEGTNLPSEGEATSLV
jgi:hypothetical protein